MVSIRRTLVLWLSLFFSIILIVGTGLTYWSAQREVADLFDAQLSQAAAVLSQIESTSPYSPEEQTLKQKIYAHHFEKKIAFQIWEGDKLVLRSFTAPEQRMSDSPGYSDKDFGGHHWRVFLFTGEISQRQIYTAERYDIRNELIRDTTLDVVLPLTLALPLSLLTIWLTIGRSLLPVIRIADNVRRLSPQHLDPLEISHPIPREISPLLNALNSLFAKLKTAFERERRFTSDAAHELQTPLASIKTQAQVALRSDDVDEKRHALLKIEEGVNRTSHLVQQLLTLSRYDPGTIMRQYENVKLDFLAAETIAELVPAAYAKHIDIGLHAPVRIILQGNPAGLKILLRNLIDNAIRYTPKSGKVNVSIFQDDLKAILQICNTGPGIPLATRERVFERFYRGEDNQHITGSGLGLSIAKQIANLHHAEITLFDHENGSEFCIRVTFPT
jgi:two-component system, OmpR family, sensor histidine kinase QseC